MQNKGPYYITTAIAYTSGKPHIGNSYEIVLADAIARFKRKDGYDVRFQTGTDEHGQKNEIKAKEAGVTPKEFVDKIAGEIKDKQIRSHPDRNRLLRVMGVEWEKSKYELSEEGALNDGDAFLMCSDGFWEPITEKEMCRLLKKSNSVEDWLNAMQITVKTNGKETNMDNNTAIAVLYRKDK